MSKEGGEADCCLRGFSCIFGARMKWSFSAYLKFYKQPLLLGKSKSLSQLFSADHISKIGGFLFTFIKWERS